MLLVIPSLSSCVSVPTQMEAIVGHIKDQNLRFTLSFGVGIHHAGLHERDRRTIEQLFVDQKIQVGAKVISMVTTHGMYLLCL